MTEGKERPGAPGGAKRSGAADRGERLAAALRENLKRRKAQARGRAAGAAPPADREGDGPSLPSPSGSGKD